MHHSTDPNNFRNSKYLDECKAKSKAMITYFHQYISYRTKLKEELTMSDEQKNELDKIDYKLGKNILRVFRLAKIDGLFNDKDLQEYEEKIIKELYKE